MGHFDVDEFVNFVSDEQKRCEDWMINCELFSYFKTASGIFFCISTCILHWYCPYCKYLCVFICVLHVYSVNLYDRKTVTSLNLGMFVFLKILGLILKLRYHKYHNDRVSLSSSWCPLLTGVSLSLCGCCFSRADSLLFARLTTAINRQHDTADSVWFFHFLSLAEWQGR